MEKLTREITVAPDAPQTACDLLARQTGLTKGRIKDAMTKGAIWLKKRKGKLQRLRRATALVQPGNLLVIHYDAALLALVPPQASLISDQGHYSVWEKPAGLMAQGTQYGDHCSLLRQAEVFFKPQRQVFLVHRLDREASGLMLIAHSREAGSQLSRLFQQHLIAKRYQVQMLGNILTRQGNRIDIPLDGKTALTEYEALIYDPATNTSLVTVRTEPAGSIRSAAILTSSATRSWVIPATAPATRIRRDCSSKPTSCAIKLLLIPAITLL
ncbi:MAG: RNA pseudouridine synthase [Proteobacteria bacterium]|nr:RNA pseudouridine synthase [Pseudomonadota bacterium]